MIASLFAMPASRSLFAENWMPSGSASRVLTPAQAADFTAAFLLEAGVAPGDGAALENLPIEAILATQRKVAAFDPGDRNAQGGTMGVVEGGTSLSEYPLRALERGDHRGVPLVLGHARDEALLWFATGAIRVPHMFEEVEAEAIRFSGARDGARLFAFYRERFPDADPVGPREKFLSDAVCVVPALRTAQVHVRAGGDAFPVWLRLDARWRKRRPGRCAWLRRGFRLGRRRRRTFPAVRRRSLGVQCGFRRSRPPIPIGSRPSIERTCSCGAAGRPLR